MTTDNKALAERLVAIADGIESIAINVIYSVKSYSSEYQEVMEYASELRTLTASPQVDEGRGEVVAWWDGTRDDYRKAFSAFQTRTYTIPLTVPQPQGDASPHPDDEASIDKAWQRFQAALSTPQARPDGDCTCHYLPSKDCPHKPHNREPAPTVDGGAEYEAKFATAERLAKSPAIAKCAFCGANIGELHAFDCTELDTHPTPAPDAVGRLVEAAEAFPEEPNPYTYRIARAKLRKALQPFTAAQKERK